MRKITIKLSFPTQKVSPVKSANCLVGLGGWGGVGWGGMASLSNLIIMINMTNKVLISFVKIHN